MSHKRKASELSGGDGAPQSFQKKSRQAFKNHGAPHKAKGHKRHQPTDDSAKSSSTHVLRNRIRDLRRLLEHVDNEPKHRMPANVRIERERELEACEHELAEKQGAAREAELRKKMIGKYHQVRFFDRQKATRILKKLNRQLSTLQDSSEKPALERKIHNAEVDVNYAIYYPLMKPYSSLYPKNKRETSKSEEPEDDNDRTEQGNGAKGDLEMWKRVEKAMEDGTLDALRNEKPGRAGSLRTDDDRLADKRKKKDKKSQSGASRDTKKAPAQEEEDESDGGFFE